MKIAIVHDSITQMGGAERVLSALHEIYPDAPVFTLVYDKRLASHFEGWKIVSSPLQYLYNIAPRLQFFLPLIPAALRFFDFSGFDAVISSSSAFAKGIRAPKKVLHINYCHTPARFLWIESESYLREEMPAFLRPLARIILAQMRKWDLQSAERINFFIANSKNVQDRIKKIYGRDSEIIYPFADTNFFYPTAPKENFYLLAGRLQAHKRADLVVRVFNRLKLPLHVVGAGRALPRLREIAGDNIIFLGRADDEILRREYSAAQALIFPQEEDFGIIPIEANACGTPVIAYGKGGALETVIENKTGVFFSKQTESSLEEALARFHKMRFSPEDLFAQAERFNKQTFKEKITSHIGQCAEIFLNQDSAKTSAVEQIAVDLRSLNMQVSGVENYLLNLLRTPQFKSSGAFGIFNGRRQSPDYLLLSSDIDIPVARKRLPNRIFNLLLYAFSIPKFENFFRNFGTLWMPDLRLFALKPKTKFALTVHDLSAIIHPEFYSLKRKLWHKAIKYKNALARASVIFAVSEYTRFDLMKKFKIRADKIKVAYPGINHEVFRQNLDERLAHKVKGRYGLPEKYVLCISTLQPRKNISAVITAFEQLENQEVELVIAGNLGWLYSSVLEQMRKSPKKDKIMITGYVDERDKPYIISGAKAVCYPSFYEGFGFVPLEAMACGVPVITSARTSIPEICGDAALLVEPMQISELASAINALLSDNALREKLIAKGLKRAKKFTWEKTASEILPVLAALNN